VRNLVRAGIPERVAMQMTGHKDALGVRKRQHRGECDLVAAAKKLKLFQLVAPVSSDRDGLASTKPRIGEVGHSLGTIGPDRGSRRRASL
jgi:hypothetical protein